MKRSPLKRTTPLKRGDKPLRADPEKVHQWKRSSAKRLPAKSAQRIEDTPERQALVRRVLQEEPTCRARILFCCTVDSTEVNEIIRRSQWAEGYLVRSNTQGLCHNCHAYITTHPDWAEHHGHQIKGSVRDDPRAYVYEAARWRALKVRLQTVGRCDVGCEVDHRV